MLLGTMPAAPTSLGCAGPGLANGAPGCSLRAVSAACGHVFRKICLLPSAGFCGELPLGIMCLLENVLVGCRVSTKMWIELAASLMSQVSIAVSLMMVDLRVTTA